MSVGGGYAVACAARHPDRVAALGLVATQPPGPRDDPVDALVDEFRPEFLAWRATVDPDDPDDEALVGRWLEMLPSQDAGLVAGGGPGRWPPPSVRRCPSRRVTSGTRR